VLRDEDTDADGDCTDDGGSERLYYTQDANFNVTALVETDGDVVERYVYDPYGNRTIYDDDWSDEVSWANSKRNEILFTGHRRDPETGLYVTLYRMYHPTLGRWLQRDPIGYADEMGLYEYALSAPLGLLDADGQEALGWTERSAFKTWLASRMRDEGAGSNDQYQPYQGQSGAGAYMPYGGTLHQRAYRYCAQFATLEALGAAQAMFGRMAKDAIKFFMNPKDYLAKRAKEVLEEATEEAKKQFMAWLEDQQVLTFEKETRGTECFCKGIVVFMPSTNEYRGIIHGKVGGKVSSEGTTDCCDPEDFSFIFTGEAGRDDDGDLELDKFKLRTRGKVPYPLEETPDQ